MSEIGDLKDLLRLARYSIGDPRGGAALVLRQAFSREALWLMFCLVIVSTVFIGEIVNMVVIERAGEAAAATTMTPIRLGVLQGLMLVGMAIAVHRIGRFFGGQGDFDGALALITFLQFVFVLVQIVQLLLLIVAPPLSLIVLILSMGLFFWLLVNFIAELHGFSSIGQVFLAVLVCTIVVAFILAQIAAALGLGPPI